MFLDEGTVKSARGDGSAYGKIESLDYISYGEVVSVDDSAALGRIQVRIKGPRAQGGDDGIADVNLPFCFPLIPKLLSIQPKVGEAVLIFIFRKDRQHTDRLYVGPIISQPQLLQYDPLYMSALAGFSFGSLAPNVSIDSIPELNGVFPDPQDVSIQGRYNTDITQLPNEIRVRAGKFVTSTPNAKNPYPITFNTDTQTYIQIKNEVVINPQNDPQNQQKGTVINVVSNKINLLTHANGNPRFNLTDPNDLITDDELANILMTAHPLMFGDITLQYLRLLKDAFLNHVHNGNGNAPTDLTASGNKQSVATFKKQADALENSMLSQNIKIN